MGTITDDVVAYAERQEREFDAILCELTDLANDYGVKPEQVLLTLADEVRAGQIEASTIALKFRVTR